MRNENAEQLASKRCPPCEGKVDKLSPEQARERLQAFEGWRLSDDAQQIRKDWEVKHFAAGMEFLNRVAKLAEREGHHPDLHLEGYRNVSIVLWTHALGGLSQSDFILASKIDQLPVRLRKKG